MLGLAIATFWLCINRPPWRYSYVKALEIANDLDLFREWTQVLLAATASVFVSLVLAFVWLSCICKYIIASCLSSTECFASFATGVLLFAIVSRIYRKAWAAECSLLLECDHVLRWAGLKLESKGKVYEIVFEQCRQFYYTPEPLFTRGLCKQCYGVERFTAQWWTGAAAFSILIWQVALRHVATHLVRNPWASWSLWAALFLISGVVWYPLVRGRWHVLFYWPRGNFRSSDHGTKDVPPPRLIADNKWAREEIEERIKRNWP
jgi:hypothetical protein